MLFPINQISTGLEKIHEIPRAIINNLKDYEEFGDELLPKWFVEKYGPRKADGLYAKAKAFFEAVKKSGKEQEIIECYNNALLVKELCFGGNSDKIHIEKVDLDVSTTAFDFFGYLFTTLGVGWFEKFAGLTVTDYITNFKETNEVYLCPICGIESITSSDYEATAALDHWMPKAKYPFTSAEWNNLLPLGKGCNQAPRKGQNEIIWKDNLRSERQQFLYPFIYLGDLKISLKCITEPNIKENYGKWEFIFKGVDDNHQNLIDNWNSLFAISDRWIDIPLKDFQKTWEKMLAKKMKNKGNNPSDINDYSIALNAYKNEKFDIGYHIDPNTRVQWFYLDFVTGNEISTSLYKAHHRSVTEQYKLL